MPLLQPPSRLMHSCQLTLCAGPQRLRGAPGSGHIRHTADNDRHALVVAAQRVPFSAKVRLHKSGWCWQALCLSMPAHVCGVSPFGGHSFIRDVTRPMWPQMSMSLRCYKLQQSPADNRITDWCRNEPQLGMQVLTGIINTTEVPFSTYVAHPRTPLHLVDARVKQVWLVALLILIPRVYWQFRLGLVAAVILLTLICLPSRLSKAQLGRLLPLAMLLFTTTALTADQVMLSGPSHLAPPDVQGLPSMEALAGGYKYDPIV